MKFAEEAAAADAVDEAAEVLDAATKSLAKPISQAQAAQRSAKARWPAPHRGRQDRSPEEA